MNEKLLSTIRFYFAQSVFMNSIHYKAYDRLNNVQKRNNRIVFWISGITLIVIILKIMGLEQEFDKLLSILSFCGLILTGTSLIFSLYNKEDIGEIKCQHRNIAEEYKILRNRYMFLIEEAMSNAFDEEILRNKNQIILEQYNTIGKYAPTTTGNDYTNAQNGLGLTVASDEEFTWSDNEIDRFLPKALRIAKED
ncbi:MAG: SLATT domain-containing protein [Bacteroidales bacterium]|nr:SLATT domain-containing protein [Bacteroidales bacterium]